MFTRDQDDFNSKWNKFSADGLDKLVVIADFDDTLTTAFKPTGERAPSSHGIIMESDILDEETHAVARKIFETYYPIEQSADLTKTEKIPYLIEWWTKEHDLMIEHGVTREAVVQAVEERDVTFRDRFTEIFELLESENVPTFIFSAGLYDVIHAVLNKEYAKSGKTPPKNVHVVSNMMRFDESGKLVDFGGTIIHSLNKSASAITETDFWKQCQLEKRHNILLLGDALGDANMADGIDYEDDEIVRIAILNDGVEDKLDQYLQHFDAVLTSDSSLSPVERLLRQLEK